MAAKMLMVLSAGIVFTLGVTHLAYTFWGSKLTPRDPALEISMSQISPVVTKETTMWQCWVGVNASHSMGLILFGLVFGFLDGSRPTPLSIAFPSRRRVGNAGWLGCAAQGIFFQCAFRRHQHFFGLLRGQHCPVAGLIRNAVNEKCNRDNTSSESPKSYLMQTPSSVMSGVSCSSEIPKYGSCEVW